MKRWVKQNTDISSAQVREDLDVSLSDVSIARLLDQGLLALSREIKNLLVASSKGKLGPADARDLRDHLKLLFELKDRENESLKNITDEQLKEQAQEALKDIPDESFQDVDPSGSTSPEGDPS